MPDPLPLSKLLGVDEFGRSLPGGGVTGTTIRLWIKAGLPCTREGGSLLIDPVVGVAWCEANRPEKMAELRHAVSTGRGGTRSRAGRPRKNPLDPKWRETNRDAVRKDPHAGPASGGLGFPDTPPESGSESSGGHPAAGAPPVVSINPDTARKNRNQADKEFELARAAKLKNDERAGTLVPVAEVTAAWTRALEVVNQKFDGIVSGAAERVMMRTGLSGDQRPVVEAEIRAEVEREKAAAVKAMEAGAAVRGMPGVAGMAMVDLITDLRSPLTQESSTNGEESTGTEDGG